MRYVRLLYIAQQEQRPSSTASSSTSHNKNTDSNSSSQCNRLHQYHRRQPLLPFSSSVKIDTEVDLELTVCDKVEGQKEQWWKTEGLTAFGKRKEQWWKTEGTLMKSIFMNLFVSVSDWFIVALFLLFSFVKGFLKDIIEKVVKNKRYGAVALCQQTEQATLIYCLDSSTPNSPEPMDRKKRLTEMPKKQQTAPEHHERQSMEKLTKMPIKQH
ncbi:hypothetical protein LXL04_003551 [Taraxacum kok-saghyz]